MGRTRLDTVLMSYPWRGNSYSSSSSRERRGGCSCIIIIRMGPIGRYIIHYTRHTILIATRHHHEWLLHCHPCIKSSIPTYHHRIIEQSTASYCTHRWGAWRGVGNGVEWSGVEWSACVCEMKRQHHHHHPH